MILRDLFRELKDNDFEVSNKVRSDQPKRSIIEKKKESVKMAKDFFKKLL